MTRPLVVKLGGELIETPANRSRIASVLSACAAERRLVVVHGGGRAIDAACDRQGIATRKVDGVRVTDDDTLEVVIAVLGGLANTQLVAALVGCGAAAVGLSGVDAGFGRAERLSPRPGRSGALIDLGHVGDPVSPDTSLIDLLLSRGFVPVVASLGVSADADVLNVNADVMACRLAEALGADLVIAGTTAGVLDAAGRTIAALDAEGIDALLADGTATDGMVAKLGACRAALESGVAGIRLVDGRLLDPSMGAAGFGMAPGTLVTRTPRLAQRFG